MRPTISLGVFLAALTVNTPLVHSETLTPEKYYREALKIAQEQVSRELSARGSGSLSASTPSLLVGRAYRPGDTWTVASWKIDRVADILRPPSEIPASELRDPVFSHSGLFRFTVVDVINGPEPKVRVEIVQLRERDFSPPDPAIKKITVTWNSELKQLSKEYQRTADARSFRVSAEGVRSPMTILEMFAIEAPDLTGATRAAANQAPRIPLAIRSAVQKLGFSPSLDQSAWIEASDFFGRPIEALWQRGDLWPSYLKTGTGISILVKEVP